MGSNPSRNPFKRARLGLDVGAQAEVDEYKARSVWSTWWQLDEKIRRRFFAAEERRVVTRYGARLDELSCLRDLPNTERETRFVKVCMGELEPESATERLWLLVQLVCRYHRAIHNAARAGLAENDAIALRGENNALKARCDHLERHCVGLSRQLAQATAERSPSICNVVHATLRFRRPEICGPAQAWRVMSAGRREPLGSLTAGGLIAA